MFYLISLLCLSHFQSFAVEKYSLADLQVLADNNEYKEFFSHAKDILPSKRQQRWRTLVIDQAKSYVDYLRSTKNYDLAKWEEIERLSLWTQLKYDDFFQIKRNSYAKSFFENCFVKYEQEKCLSKMQKFWQTSNKDPDIGFHFARLSSGLLKLETAWLFVTDLIKNEQGHFYCDKPLITDALTYHLQLKSRKDVASFKGKVGLQNMATSKCWNKMIPALKASMKSLPARESSGLYFALDSLKQLSQVESDLWLTKYLLEKPKIGTLFNQAWSRIKELGSDYKRREMVLNSLTALNHLPDESFNHQKKSKVILRHLNRYFPEYISTYANTCLSYLEGTKVFEFGNPTPSCKSLFNNADKRVLSKSVRARFNEAKRL